MKTQVILTQKEAQTIAMSCNHIMCDISLSKDCPDTVSLPEIMNRIETHVKQIQSILNSEV